MGEGPEARISDGRARHRRAVTIGGVLTGGAAIVVTALLTDATGRTLDLFRQASERDTLVASVNGGEGSVAWLMPPGVEPPFTSAAGCGATWPELGQQAQGAVPAHAEWRIDLTGLPSDSIIIHEVTAKIVDSDPIPAGSALFVCAVGGDLAERTAILHLTDPGATEYYSSDGQDLRGLSYQLQPEEQGSFYLTYRNTYSEQAIYRFEVLLEYADRSGNHVVNLHDLTGEEPFVGVEACGVPISDGEDTIPATPCP